MLRIMGVMRDESSSDESHLREAIALAVASVAAGGGPFGAVVVRGDEVIARAGNRVVLDADPTAHAEIVALRTAARALRTHELRDCTLYASSRPCPMCFGALHWAGVPRLVYSADYADASRAGFDDELLHDELFLPDAERLLTIERMLPAEGIAPFTAWNAAEDRIPY